LGIAFEKEILTMSKVVGTDPGTTNACVAEIEDRDLARHLEGAFQISCHAQGDWVVKHDPGQSTDDAEKDDDSST
jgi:hypothetical protein